MSEVVAHVVAAEGKHGHGIAAQLSDGTGRSCGRLRLAVAPRNVPCCQLNDFGDERHYSGAASAEQDGVDRHALRIFPLGGDHGALPAQAS